MNHRLGHHIGNLLHVPGLVLKFGYELNMGSLGPCQEILSVLNKQLGMSFAGHNRRGSEAPFCCTTCTTTDRVLNQFVVGNLNAYAGRYRTVSHSSS